MHVELAIEFLDVRRHGVLGDAEQLRDASIGAAVREKLDHIDLAGGQWAVHGYLPLVSLATPYARPVPATSPLNLLTYGLRSSAADLHSLRVRPTLNAWGSRDWTRISASSFRSSATSFSAIPSRLSATR